VNSLLSFISRTESLRRSQSDSFCQIIESVNRTLKAQLDLERHGGPQTPRRPRASAATNPRAHRSDLAQRDHRGLRPRTITPRLRPLTQRALGTNHLVRSFAGFPLLGMQRPCRSLQQERRSRRAQFSRVGGSSDDEAAERLSSHGKSSTTTQSGVQNPPV
jgi:hypothetical protein